MRTPLLYLFAGPALAQTLTPVQTSSGGVNWTLLLILGGAALLLIGGFVWFKRKNPAAAAQVQSTASADIAAAVSAIGRWIASAEARFGVALPPSPGTAATVVGPAAEPAPAGKSGQPGIFTATVTGDPKVDLPAITTQYFQS